MKKKSTSTPEPNALVLVKSGPIHAQQLFAKKIGQPEELAGIVLGLHNEIGLAFGRGLWLSAYCGKALDELKRALGHGQWLPFVEKHFEPVGLKERTVRNYMAVWDEARARLVKSANVADLPDKPLSEFTSTDQQMLVSGLQKICKGETARSLAGDVLEDAGIAKKPHGAALRASAGGDKGGRRGKLNAEDKEAIENEAAAADRDQLIAASEQVLAEKSWLRWTSNNPEDRKSLATLKGNLLDILAHLKNA